jgi:hypothetical protein
MPITLSPLGIQFHVSETFSQKGVSLPSAIAACIALPPASLQSCSRLHARRQVLSTRPLWYRSRCSTYPTGVRAGTVKWRFAHGARSLEMVTAARGSPTAPKRYQAEVHGLGRPSDTFLTDQESNAIPGYPRGACRSDHR